MDSETKNKILAVLDSFQVGESLITSSTEQVLKSAMMKEIEDALGSTIESMPALKANIAEISAAAMLKLDEFLKFTGTACVLLNALLSHIIEEANESGKAAEEQSARHSIVDCWAENLRLKNSFGALLAELESVSGPVNKGYFLSRTEMIVLSARGLNSRLAVEAAKYYGFSHVAGFLDAVSTLISQRSIEGLHPYLTAHITSRV
ncbi:MAG: hypothetical protein J5J00_03700 [Deltaproteobacteria bacterium]|nr:hypothetical protein [Deltaproteobacteria bacterium]